MSYDYLDTDGLNGHGIAVVGKLFPDRGEVRAAVRKTLGEDVDTQSTLTVVPEDMSGGWQGAHAHQFSREAYMVQAGVLLVASKSPGESPELQEYGPGSFFVFEPNVGHDIFVRPGSMFWATRWGNGNKTDRIQDFVLNEWISENCPDGELL